ncbi:Uncharacterised protein [Escherichia coli]|uniref:Uncharacterized protein n=1 Tax=Escherichia coli TaxID=562 RepID=A0A376W214_ECOLX|nr:Uncharacterised protein [Escherichia coli]
MLIDDIDFAGPLPSATQAGPSHRKNAGSLGSTGGKNGGKLRLADGQLPATTDLKN